MGSHQPWDACVVSNCLNNAQDACGCQICCTWRVCVECRGGSTPSPDPSRPCLTTTTGHRGRNGQNRTLCVQNQHPRPHITWGEDSLPRPIGENEELGELNWGISGLQEPDTTSTVLAQLVTVSELNDVGDVLGTGKLRAGLLDRQIVWGEGP